MALEFNVILKEGTNIQLVNKSNTGEYAEGEFYGLEVKNEAIVYIMLREKGIIKSFKTHDYFVRVL